MKVAFGTMKADLVFEFDADFSHDPNRIPDFLKKIDEGYDFVLGSRYIPGGSIPSNWGLHRKFLSIVGNLFINAVWTTFVIRDWTTGYRAITKRVYDAVQSEMYSERFSGYTFQIGFLHKALRKGFKIAEVPFQFVDRTEGHSKLGAEYLKNTLIYVLKVRFQEIIAMRVFKFGVTGGIGFVVNTLGLFLFSRLPVIQGLAASLAVATNASFINVSGLSSALGAECAIVSNFTLNNLWTFRDRTFKSPWEIVPKFIQFNLSSFGAVLIQFVVVGAGTMLTGQSSLSRFIWLVVATAIGMVLNYIIYSKFIWKEKK
jgi:dolichol-phosphate mannosyltransferase